MLRSATFDVTGVGHLFPARPSYLAVSSGPPPVATARSLVLPPPCRGLPAKTTSSLRRVRCELSHSAFMESDTNPTSKMHRDLTRQALKDNIKEALNNITLSKSSYDTAWVAMVPSPTSPGHPCFPQCLEWILRNQNIDGSWTTMRSHKYLVKDVLSSTFACILALKKWNVGEDLIQRGIDFMRRNSSFLVDKKQHNPIGFNIIFPRMIQYGKELGLDIPIAEDVLRAMFSVRDLELKRETNSTQWSAYLAYIVEGIEPIQDYNELKKYQNKNGSLFNSPAATAAMLIHIQDTKAMNYLRSAVLKFGNAVPALYPSCLYARLSMVDTLQKLGIARHFTEHTKSVLNEAYRSWLRNEEEMHIDASISAMAFRHLRLNGYHISPEILTHNNGEELLSYKSRSCLQSMATALELYKASQLEICQDGSLMKELNCWSHQFLKLNSSTFEAHNDFENLILEEVNYNLKFPFANNLDRLEHKRSIENYNINTIQCLKASFKFEGVDTSNILRLAMDDFNFCQSVYQKEFHIFQRFLLQCSFINAIMQEIIIIYQPFLDRWVQENKLDQLIKDDLNRIVYSYFSAAATIVPPNLFDARMAWAKNSLLVILFDDLFDVSGSVEEQDNMMDLCRRWDANYEKYCCSERVYIIFDALYTTIKELGDKAYTIHGYHVTRHLIELWVEVVNSMYKEEGWTQNGTVPTMEEYITNGYGSSTMGPIVLSATYFVGSELSWDIIRSQEYTRLFVLLSTICRLLNDIQGYEREAKVNKLNGVSIKVLNGHGKVSVEDAKRELWEIVDSSKTELLELVLNGNCSVVPRPCKDLFWNMCRVLHAFYNKNDGYRGDDLVEVVKAILYEPINASNLHFTNSIN